MPSPSSPGFGKKEGRHRTVEELSADHGCFDGISRHLARFFGDPEASRCLRKDLLRVVEHRLRAVALGADPADRHGYGTVDFGGLGHPLDPLAAATLSRETGLSIPGPATRGAVIKAAAALVAWGISLNGAVLTLWVRYGRAQISPRYAQVAGPNILTASMLARFREACVARGVWSENAILFVWAYDLPPPGLFG